VDDDIHTFEPVGVNLPSRRIPKNFPPFGSWRPPHNAPDFVARGANGCGQSRSHETGGSGDGNLQWRPVPAGHVSLEIVPRDLVAVAKGSGQAFTDHASTKETAQRTEGEFVLDFILEE
jgi:hypothetical protein